MIPKDKYPHWLRIKCLPFYKDHENIWVQFVVLDPDEVKAFIVYLKELKAKGEILDFMIQQIQKFWTAKGFMGLVDKMHGPMRRRRAKYEREKAKLKRSKRS